MMQYFQGIFLQPISSAILWLIACFSIHLLTWFFSQLWPSLWKQIEWHGRVSPQLLFDIATMTRQKQHTLAKDNQTNN